VVISGPQVTVRTVIKYVFSEESLILIKYSCFEMEVEVSELSKLALTSALSS